MALIDDVKTICDRLGPRGWGDLLRAVTGGSLNIEQPSPSALRSALQAEIARIDLTMPGFEDFNAAGRRAITPSKLSESLLYHALASPRVVRGASGILLQDLPRLLEIETVENFVYGIEPLTLSSIQEASGATRLAVTVFATEYRPAPDCAEGPHADLMFSRTGIARIGTARPKYLPTVRGFSPEDEDNPNAFRVVPVRLTAWLAAPMKGNLARIMRPLDPDDNGRNFWVPVHKLFDGPECIRGLDLSLRWSAKFVNMKLQRVQGSVSGDPPRVEFPFLIEEGLAELRLDSECGRVAVVPVSHDTLVRPAIINGEPLTYQVPPGKASGFATYATRSPQRDGFDAEILPVSCLCACPHTGDQPGLRGFE